MKTPLGMILAVAISVPAGAAAQAPKLGYFDLQRAVAETDEGKAIRAELTKDFEAKQQQVNARRDEFEKARAEFEKQSVVMSEQARREKEAELERKARELAGLFQQLQGDLSKREGQAMGGLLERMTGIVREIAQADGFTLIFERSDAGIAYGAPALDVTNEVIRKYNARFPPGAAKAGAKPAGAGAKPAAAAAKPATPAAKPAAPAADKK